MKTFKGFDKDLKCRGFQYEVGKTYEHEGEVKACKEGFHACEHPLDVFSYYPPASSRFCVVTQSGETNKGGDDSKVSSAKISIEAEVSLSEFIESAVAYVVGEAKKLKKNTNGKDNKAASNSGYRGAATASGYKSRAQTSIGSAIFLVERNNDDEIINVFAGVGGKHGVEPDTWYELVNGKLKEV